MAKAPWTDVRKNLAQGAVQQFYENLSYWARKHPNAHPERHGVEVIKDIHYQEDSAKEHLVDVYRPEARDEPLPVVLYVHGGGFRILSKDTHWVFGLGFARRGYVVFNINYRLAPKHPFPAALEDVCHAYQWVVANAETYGGDPSRILLAGESAGANLVTALSLAACTERPEEWARPILHECPAPIAVMPSCGLHQVSDPERFGRRRKLPKVVSEQIRHISADYLGPLASDSAASELANPLLRVESGLSLARPLPPFQLTVGTRDPILDDTRRLAAALEECGVECETTYYPGEGHAFQALVWRKAAQKWWRDSIKFMSRTVSVQRDE